MEKIIINFLKIITFFIKCEEKIIIIKKTCLSNRIMTKLETKRSDGDDY